MKKLLLPLISILALGIMPTACHMAPKDDPGDTVAASEFAPIDTAALNRKARAAGKLGPIKDSVDIFYVGDGSTSKQLQLVSYPSRRDTLLYSKARHMKKSGNADFGHIIRVKLYITDKGDTLVQRTEEIKPEDLKPKDGKQLPHTVQD